MILGGVVAHPPRSTGIKVDFDLKPDFQHDPDALGPLIP
jgi:hypothetical protein